MVSTSDEWPTGSVFDSVGDEHKIEEQVSQSRVANTSRDPLTQPSDSVDNKWQQQRMAVLSRNLSEQIVASPPLSPVIGRVDGLRRQIFSASEGGTDRRRPISWPVQLQARAAESPERADSAAQPARSISLRSDTERSETPLSLTSVTPSDSDNDAADAAGVRSGGTSPAHGRGSWTSDGSPLRALQSGRGRAPAAAWAATAADTMGGVDPVDEAGESGTSWSSSRSVGDVTPSAGHWLEHAAGKDDDDASRSWPAGRPAAAIIDQRALRTRGNETGGGGGGEDVLAAAGRGSDLMAWLSDQETAAAVAAAAAGSVGDVGSGGPRRGASAGSTPPPRDRSAGMAVAAAAAASPPSCRTGRTGPGSSPRGSEGGGYSDSTGSSLRLGPRDTERPAEAGNSDGGWAGMAAAAAQWMLAGSAALAVAVAVAATLLSPVAGVGGGPVDTAASGATPYMHVRPGRRGGARREGGSPVVYARKGLKGRGEGGDRVWRGGGAEGQEAEPGPRPASFRAHARLSSSL